jgi:thioredoxin 1
MPVEVFEDTFEAEVLQAETPVLAYFFLPSCAKCVVLKSAAEALERRYVQGLKLAILNITKVQKLARRSRLLTAPAFILYRQGREIERFVGDTLSVDSLERFLQDGVGGNGMSGESAETE